MAADPSCRTDVALTISGLTKAFGSARALDGVDLQLHRGRVHALLGANGCGKSTLVKVLAGYHVPDRGKVTFAGATQDQAAIAFVHQDLGLIPTMSVAENFALVDGYQSVAGGTINWTAAHRVAGSRLEELGIGCTSRQTVAELGPAEQTMVAVARALASLPTSDGVLVLDEPTARLPVEEADKLLQLVQRLKRSGVSVLYISHRLDEVFQIADDVTVLRDGRSVHSGLVDNLDRAALTRLIIGRELNQVEPRSEIGADDGGSVLELRNVSGLRVRDVDLRIRPGELVGVAGLVGSGRSELGRLIFGLQKTTAGTIAIDGHAVTGQSPRQAVTAGVAYVPQDRRSGLFPGLSVMDNATLPRMGNLMSWMGLSSDKVRRAAAGVVEDMQVKTDGIGLAIEALSGGNQQKVALGKWLRRDLRLLILDEPTQGIDVGSRADIFAQIQRAALERQIGVLVLDSDLEILSDYCDRVAVMTQGRISNELTRTGLSPEALSHAVYGH
jgi:ribose transport system ATP-binding protein